MTLKVKITNPDGSNPIILDKASDVKVFETLLTSDEGVSFQVAKNDPKAGVLNPDDGGYTKFWEVWDTIDNRKINFGSISQIDDSSGSWRITGTGKSGLLNDIISTRKTFYQYIDSIADDIRYENIAIEPRTSSLVYTTASGNAIFGSITVDNKFHGLSEFSKDNAIDDYTGYIKPGQNEPSNTYFTTDSFWSGMSVNDSLIVDLGQKYDISKIRLLFPWWGGAARLNNRSYDYTISYAVDDEAPTSVYKGREFGPFHTLYGISNNKLVTLPETPLNFMLGATLSGHSYDLNTFNVANDQSGPVNMRYLKVHITDVRAWYGTSFDDDPSTDAYEFQCDPDYVTGSIPALGNRVGVMVGKTINDRALEPANDCNASVVEVGLLKEIVGKDTIKPLALQRIDNNNIQITYSHTPLVSETTTTSDGFRQFEPGSFFRNFTITWSGANTAYTKFYTSDCTNCYPDSFNFGIMDHNNNLILGSDNSTGTNIAVRSGTFTKHILTKGASNATVTWADCWPATLNQLSWGGSYSYSKIAGDTARIHFRGESFKWYATIPEGETGAIVDIEIRNKDSNGQWTSWTLLENNLQLPSNVYAEPVYEITYESGYLQSNTVYEIRITNTDGGFCSIDSIEGYWSASFTFYNEDSTKIHVSRPETFTQIYDKRFSNGSMYKWNTVNSRVGMTFEGDRVIVQSAKGRNHGTMNILIFRYDKLYGLYDPGLTNHLMIPGGDVDGSININLDTGKRGNESTQHIIFDSNDYFTDGLPWGTYRIHLGFKTASTYSTTVDEVNSNNFLYRCKNCVADTSGAVTVNKYIYLDTVGVHEKVGVSVQFDNETNLEQIKALAEALQVEWDVTTEGLVLEPRIGTDTDIVLREGENTLVNWQIVNDVQKVASILYSSGSDIDGIPLFTITEDKKNRETLGRTVMRREDFRNIGDYQQLVGVSRGELRKRRVPEKRISVTHIARNLSLNKGDSFILYTQKMGPLRVRILRKEISEGTSGRQYDLECVKWPQMV